MDLNATGDVNLYQIRAVDSTVKIEAGKGATDISDGGSLRFDNAIIRESDLVLAANDTIGMHQREGGGTDCSEYGQRVFIQVDEDDTDAVSSLTLTANGQIGEEDNHLVVDIPEAVTLKIPVVGDLFADSLELEPKVTRSGEEKDVRITKDDLAYDLIKPVGHPDNPMVNEFMGTPVFATIVEYGMSVPSNITGAYYYDARNAMATAITNYINGADLDSELAQAEDTVNFAMGF